MVMEIAMSTAVQLVSLTLRSTIMEGQAGCETQ